jgi:hypothetical protein
MPKKAKTSDQMRAGWLKSKYGMTWAEYQKMLKTQRQRCAICGRKEKRPGRSGKIRTLSVDHDHRTGSVRELLCADCNVGLGCVDDNIKTLQTMIAYLQKHKV